MQLVASFNIFLQQCKGIIQKFWGGNFGNFCGKSLILAVNSADFWRTASCDSGNTPMAESDAGGTAVSAGDGKYFNNLNLNSWIYLLLSWCRGNGDVIVQVVANSQWARQKFSELPSGNGAQEEHPQGLGNNGEEIGEKSGEKSGENSGNGVAEETTETPTTSRECATGLAVVCKCYTVGNGYMSCILYKSNFRNRSHYRQTKSGGLEVSLNCRPAPWLVKWKCFSIWRTRITRNLRGSSTLWKRRYKRHKLALFSLWMNIC